MIHCLTGELIYLDALTYTAVVECGGVGYKATVTANTLTRVSDKKGEIIRLFTYLAVREDAVELFGFSDTDEQDMFKLLITVSGVGPKAAMSILSTFTPSSLAETVAAEDTKSISKAPGVGLKTAARIVLELREKLAKLYPSTVGNGDTKQAARQSALPKSGKLSDARSALSALGYSQTEIASALGKCDISGEVEDIIRNALAELMRQ